MALLPSTLTRWQLAGAGAQNLAFIEAPMPSPTGREVLVRVDAVSLNYREHGTGGVALFGVQIARLHGAQVYVTSGSPEKTPPVLALGAAQVLPRTSAWPNELLTLTGGRGVDHVLETAGGATLGQSLQALAQGGHVAYIGVMEGAGFSGSGFDLITKRARVQGVSVGHRRALQDLVRAVDAGGLQPVVAARYPAAQLHDALAHLARGPVGKVVVTFAA